MKKNCKINTVESVDKYISAEIPDPNEHPTLHEIVMKNMIHGPCGNWCLKDGKCSKRFPKQFQEETILDADNYPAYKRANNGKTFERPRKYIVDNRYVVPYCPTLLLVFNCHLNVEIVSSTKSVKYLFKYAYKGNDTAAITISDRLDNSATFDHDETQMYIESRYASPSEAC